MAKGKTSSARPSRIRLSSPSISECSESSSLWTPSSPNPPELSQASAFNPHSRFESPALSDTSELTWISRSPSPPAECVTSTPRTRSGSTARAESVVSELSELSRSPSPPSEFESSSDGQGRLRGPKGRFLPKRGNKKRSARSSSVPRTPKRQKISLHTPPHAPKKQTGAKYADVGSPIPFEIPSDDPSTPTIHGRRSCIPDTETSGTVSTNAAAADGLGVLERLPRELRDIVYGFMLDIANAVTVKECCGPTSTKRERDACKKHGKTGFKKIAKWNGPNTGVAPGTSGKFSVLLLSKAIHEEASWVLFNQGSLVIKVAEYMAKYVNDCAVFSIRHLQDLPRNLHAQNMWMMAACFRDVQFEIPAVTLKYGDPIVYTARLSEAAALLLKAWKLLPKPKTMPEKPNTVSIKLGDLYETIPFSASTQMDEYSEWSQLHHPFETPEPDDVCNQTSHNLERMVEIIGRHRGTSEWKVIVSAPTNESADDDEKDDDGENGDDGEDGEEDANWLDGLADHCEMHDVTFELAA